MLWHFSAQNKPNKGMKRKINKPLPLNYNFTSFFEIYVEDMETKAIKKLKIISCERI